MSAQTCQHCGRKVGHDNLTQARDPFDGKVKWVCIDADACATARNSS